MKKMVAITQAQKIAKRLIGIKVVENSDNKFEKAFELFKNYEYQYEGINTLITGYSQVGGYTYTIQADHVKAPSLWMLIVENTIIKTAVAKNIYADLPTYIYYL